MPRERRTWRPITAFSGEGELYCPVASAFRVKLVRNDVLGDCRSRGLRRGGKQAAGKSFGNLHLV